MTELDDSPPWATDADTFSEVSLAKLTASALTSEFVIEHGVVPVHDARDLPPEFADNSGLCTVPGMLVPWRNPRDPEQLVWQYRPDFPVEPKFKYVFPTDLHQPLGLIKKASTDGEHRVAIVEGTMQGLAFARYAPPDTVVYAIPGCDGWSKAKNATEQLTVVEGKDVVIFLDADAGTNASVYDAGYELARFSKIYGATGAFFARAPGRGVNGIDDFLGTAAEDKRVELLARLMDSPELKPAPRKPPGKPKAKSVYGLATAEGLPDANDTALGTQWADASLMNYRWLTDDESWLACREGRWERVGSSVPASSVMKFLNFVSGQYLAAAQTKDGDQREKLEETGRNLLSSAKRTSVRMTASDYDATHVRRAELDQHPTLWCAANGVLDLDTGEVVDHNPDLMLTTGSPVPYVPGATCPRFDAFLAEVQPDEAVREYLLRVFAMAMYGEVREHVLPVMIGEGRNGKGTTNRIMHGVFGSHAEVIESSALLMRKYEKHEEEVARLAGKRLITTEETGRDSVWNVPRINSWTGGDRLKGRWMGGNSFSFNPSHTLVMATNHRPNVGQGERAFWARYREIPFEVDFSDRVDLTLEPWILENELPGVFNRLIEAGRSYRAHGLQEPAAVTMATLDAKVDADNLARFCAEHLAVTHDHELDRIANNELFEVMIKWWSQNVRGEAHPGARTFSKIMRSALGFPSDAKNPKKIGKGTDSKLTWTGIRWLNGGTVEINNGGSAASSETIMNSGRPEAPNPSTPLQPVEDPQNGSAATGPGSAARSAAMDDHEDEIVPGQKVVSARSAESAVKVRSSYTDLGNTEAGPVDHGLKSSSQEPGGENGTDRQTGQSGQQNAAPSGVVVLDLETDSADQQYDHPEPERFFRIGAYSTLDGPELVHRPEIIIERLLASRWVVGSNLVHFDLPVLGRIDPRVDVLALTREGRVLDTMITESVLNPIVGDLSGNAVGKAMKHFKLDAACERYGIPGKTHNLAAYVKKNHGGDYGAVEWDTDTELQDYVRGDITATTGLKNVLTDMLSRAPYPLKAYVMREHRVHAIASQMGVSGFTADVELNTTRRDEAVARKTELSQRLIEHYEIPTLKADGKPAKSPAATKEGKDAIYRALLSLGVADADIPRTKATAAHPQGQPSFKGELMTELAARYLEHANVEAITTLCETVGDVNGVRTIYGTVMDHLKTDGKVHPHVATFQASGRWSVTKPGLTVFGKRGIGSNGQPRVNERAVFTASDPEHVLMAIDLSQVDARAIAVHSQDHGYLDLFEPGLDAHELVARMVWGDAAYDADPKNLRHNVKAITHGVPYGMGVPKLALNAKVSEATAQRVVDTMNAAFPRLQVWKQEVRDLAGVPGAYLDNGFGRLMRPDHERAYTQGPALMGQGCARDLMMQCLLNVDDLDPRVTRMLRAQIHDEAIFEFPKADAEELKRLVVGCFSFPWAPPGASRPVSMVPDTGPFGFRWSECY